MNFEIMGEKHGQVAADMVREGKLVTNENVSLYMNKLLENMGSLAATAKESWINGFNSGFEKKVQRDSCRPADIKSMEYKEGYRSAIERTLRIPLLEMREYREKDLKAAGEKMNSSAYVKYMDGYDTGMKQQIQAIGARQALRDKGIHGATEQAMEGYLSVAKWVKTEDQKKAFVTGYKREAGLDRDPISKQQENKRKMDSAVTKQGIKQDQAYLDGYRQASAIIGKHGIKSAIERMNSFFENLKKFMQPKTLEKYTAGFKHGVKTHTQTLEQSQSMKSLEVGKTFEVKRQERKPQEHSLSR